MEKNIYNFFAAYEKRFNDALKGNTDVDGMASAFAKFFVEASPNGIKGSTNDMEFRHKIPEGTEFYKQIGTRSIEITSQDVTPIDDLHDMVKVHWRASHKNKDNSDLFIDFDVTYFLQKQNEHYKIFAYITGDEQAILKKYGLIQ